MSVMISTFFPDRNHCFVYIRYVSTPRCWHVDDCDVCIAKCLSFKQNSIGVSNKNTVECKHLLPRWKFVQDLKFPLWNSIVEVFVQFVLDPYYLIIYLISIHFTFIIIVIDSNWDKHGYVRNTIHISGIFCKWNWCGANEPTKSLFF